MEKLLCNVNISHVFMSLTVIKWRDIAVKLWCTYRVASIILYCTYWHPAIVCVLCTDCILVLTVASSSSSLVIHLAICRWVHYLCLLCWCFALLHPVVLSCCYLFYYMCSISFIVTCSLVGCPVAVISAASKKWKFQSYIRELQWKKWMEQNFISQVQQEEKQWKI